MTPVAALGASQILGYGSLYYAFPLMVPAVAGDLGTTPATLFAVFSAGLLAGGLVAPVLGRLMDRIGAPRVMAAGSLAAGGALVLMAVAPGLWSFAAAVLLVELIAGAVLYDAAFASLVLLRGTGARRAITRLTLIAGFASTLFWPLTGWLVETQGWRVTYLIYAGLHVTLGFGLHLWLSRQPAADETVPLAGATAAARPLPQALVRGAYISVAVSFALSGVLISATTVHLVGVLASAGAGAGATAYAMLMGPAQVAVRLVDALFWKALHPLSVAAISALALPAAIGLLLLGAPVWVAGPAFAVLLGFGQGLASIVRGSVPLALFGPAGYGAQLGRLALIRTVASAGAPAAFAAMLAALGLGPTLWAFLVLGLAAAVPLLALRARLGAGGHLAPLR